MAVSQLRNLQALPYALTHELLWGMLTGLNCLGYAEIDVTELLALPLPPYPNVIPEVAYKALIVVEADPLSTNKTRCVRFTEDITNPPTAVFGMPLGDLSIYEVGGQGNMDNFRIIGIEAGRTHKVRIQYYG